jgi:hypothetical protein
VICIVVQFADLRVSLRSNCLLIHSSEGPAERILQLVEPTLVAVVPYLDLFQDSCLSIYLVRQNLVGREFLFSGRFLVLDMQGFENLAYEEGAERRSVCVELDILRGNDSNVLSFNKYVC